MKTSLYLFLILCACCFFAGASSCQPEIVVPAQAQSKDQDQHPSDITNGPNFPPQSSEEMDLEHLRDLNFIAFTALHIACIDSNYKGPLVKSPCITATVKCFAQTDQKSPEAAMNLRNCALRFFEGKQ